MSNPDLRTPYALECPFCASSDLVVIRMSDDFRTVKVVCSSCRGEAFLAVPPVRRICGQPVDAFRIHLSRQMSSPAAPWHSVRNVNDAPTASTGALRRSRKELFEPLQPVEKVVDPVVATLLWIRRGLNLD